MKFPLSWLKAPLDTEADARSIADQLTNIGLEVESVEDPGERLKDFVVAHVVSAEKHPNADKLRLCMADIGANAPVQVVCGAPNARAGMKAVFAKPGTIIPATGAELKIGTIRGVESRGMLCSGRELLLNDDHDGIIELPSGAVTGAPAAAALGLTDPVFDVAITPNRGDCTSVYGIARDLAAAGLGRLREGDLSPVKGMFPSPIVTALELPPGAEDAAPMFAGRVIRGVRNGASPQWLQTWLKAVGLRPISALVDVTNFLSLDRGRPLHVFDAAKLKGNLRARFAKKGEALLALDGKTYTLDSEMVVIADDEAARSIAGVMGGEDSSCTAETTDVFIESALFDPVRVARTGRVLGIISDARYRFERGVDPEFVLPGLELASKMILEFCGGEASDVVVAGTPPLWKRTIAFAASEVSRLTGLALETPEIVRILTNLGFTVRGEAGELSVEPPSWRLDVHGPADLVEEIIRIHGLKNVPAVPMKRPYAVARPVLTPSQRRKAFARRFAAVRGFDETVHFSFIPRAHAALFGGGDETRQLENPISADLDAMRPSLVPSLLAAVARNQARGFDYVMLFEAGPQFEFGTPEAQGDAIAGVRAGPPPRHWMKNGHAPDVFLAKADALGVLEAAWGGPVTAPIRAGAAPWYHPGRSGTIALGPKVLAYFGELHPRIASAFDLKGPVLAFEIFLDAIPEPKVRSTKARAKREAFDLMAVMRDFAFVVDSTVTAESVIKAARTADRQMVEAVELFDVYEGKGVPEGKRSLAISVRLQPRERTLTEAEIDAVAQKIVNAVAKATGGVLRQ
jgi:phenylalanyl-tRNA synthetase beta chain